MISPKDFLDTLSSRGIDFFTGVPDSLLQELCACITDTKEKHVTASNEGNAVALAAGHYLATGHPGAVYMQNSGLGNAVNPLVSLTSKEVYQIPVLLIIGWRGEPGKKDEPQHLFQGAITTDLLEVLRIPYEIIEKESDYKQQIASMTDYMIKESSPAALLVRSGVFGRYPCAAPPEKSRMLREQALEIILNLCDPDDIIISTTGKTSRELYELRKKLGQAQHDFLTVGSMGHSSSIALGIALEKPSRHVVCIDGDGSLLMHMGAMAAVGEQQPRNFLHVVLHNGVHESVGGQPIASHDLDMKSIALGCGYRHYYRANDEATLTDAWIVAECHNGPQFLEILTAVGSRDDLGRPESTPQENKHMCMDFIQKGKR